MQLREQRNGLVLGNSLEHVGMPHRGLDVRLAERIFQVEGKDDLRPNGIGKANGLLQVGGEDCMPSDAFKNRFPSNTEYM